MSYNTLVNARARAGSREMRFRDRASVLLLSFASQLVFVDDACARARAKETRTKAKKIRKHLA